jgi:ABC-type Na+ efflux pump permease subunit
MIKLFKKDLILFFNDHKSYTLTFLIPVILITLFAFAYGGIEAFTGNTDNYRLLLTDLDNTELSSDFSSVLDSIDGIEVISTDLKEARALVNGGENAGALILHKGFMDSIFIGRNGPAELLYDKEQNFEAGMMQSIIINSLYSFSRNVEAQKRAYPGSQSDISNETENAVSENGSHKNNGPVLKMTSIVGENNDFSLGLIQAVAGTSILMLLFSVAGIGTSILEEKENGTISRLLFSPLRLKTILYSKMLFAFFISVLQLSAMFLFAWAFLKLDLTINPWALVLMILSTSLAVSSLGIFLAAIAKSRQQAQSLSTLIILVMSAIGGSMIPLFVMPDIMSKLAVISVNYWSIQGFYDIFWRSLPLSEILPRILILTGAAIVFTIVSIRLFSKNILKIV